MTKSVMLAVKRVIRSGTWGTMPVWWAKVYRWVGGVCVGWVFRPVTGWGGDSVVGASVAGSDGSSLCNLDKTCQDGGKAWVGASAGTDVYEKSG